MMEKIPMTASGFKALEAELNRLKNQDRHEIIKAIAEARAHGDLSENAEYHAAKERQGFIEGRIRELELKVGQAEVIDPPREGDRITFGSSVLLRGADATETRDQIVGSDEAETAAAGFFACYPGRPVSDNSGGSGYSDCFWLYTGAWLLAPGVIVESGVLKGQTSWLLRQACPAALLYAVDLDLTQRMYRHASI